MSRARAANNRLPALPAGQHTSMLEVRRADRGTRAGAAPAEQRGGAANAFTSPSHRYAVNLRSVAGEHLHLLALRQSGQRLVHVIDRIEAYRMGEVGLEQHVVHADRPDLVRQVTPLEPEARMEVGLEILAGLALQLAVVDGHFL